MRDKASNYLAPVVYGKDDSEKGRAVFAAENIQAGVLLAVWGGNVHTLKEYNRLPTYQRRISIQVEDDFFLVPCKSNAADWFNHSCNPNAGVSGQISLVALRAIKKGEEICYDYAMTDVCGYDDFLCNCKSKICRKYITGNDWQTDELQDKYNGYFSAYIQCKIKQLKVASK